MPTPDPSREREGESGTKDLSATSLTDERTGRDQRPARPLYGAEQSEAAAPTGLLKSKQLDHANGRIMGLGIG